jgi:hypothetical protein
MRAPIVIGMTIALLTLGTCERESPGGITDASANADAAVVADAAPGDDATLGVDSGVAPDADVNACADEIAALAGEIYADLWGCSAVVRLDYSREILGYQLICGNYAQVTEADARAAAQTATGYGASATMLNSVPPDGPYVFYVSPTDFGGASAVSSDTGLALFGGSIVWDGAGDITYPTTWRPAAELASGCAHSGGAGVALGYDLVFGGPLSSPEVDAAVAVVADTALMQAFWGGGYVFTTVVLRYPRSVGFFDPNTAEWVVILSGGWLE